MVISQKGWGGGMGLISLVARPSTAIHFSYSNAVGSGYQLGVKSTSPAPPPPSPYVVMLYPPKLNLRKWKPTERLTFRATRGRLSKLPN